VDPPAARPLRVLIEQRSAAATRQLLRFDALLENCDRARAVSFPAGISDCTSSLRLLLLRQIVHPHAGLTGATGGQPVECRPYSFGSRPFAHDLAVLKDTDVMVGTHGSPMHAPEVSRSE